MEKKFMNKLDDMELDQVVGSFDYGYGRGKKMSPTSAGNVI